MEELLRETLEGSKDVNKARQILDDFQIPYKDESKESGYLNLKIPVKDGMIRIYQKHMTKEITVQKWTKVRFEYSGIPTFMPGGRNTFDTAL